MARNVARMGEKRSVYSDDRWESGRKGLAIDGGIILKRVLNKIGSEGKDWINLARYRAKWRAVEDR